MAASTKENGPMIKSQGKACTGGPITAFTKGNSNLTNFTEKGLINGLTATATEACGSREG